MCNKSIPIGIRHFDPINPESGNLGSAIFTSEQLEYLFHQAISDYVTVGYVAVPEPNFVLWLSHENGDIIENTSAIYAKFPCPRDCYSVPSKDTPLMMNTVPSASSVTSLDMPSTFCKIHVDTIRAQGSVISGISFNFMDNKTKLGMYGIGFTVINTINRYINAQSYVAI